MDFWLIMNRDATGSVTIVGRTFVIEDMVKFSESMESKGI